MNKTSILAGLGIILLTCCSCNNDLVEYENNDLKVTVEKGDSWLHDFPVVLRNKQKESPADRNLAGRYGWCLSFHGICHS